MRLAVPFEPLQPVAAHDRGQEVEFAFDPLRVGHAGHPAQDVAPDQRRVLVAPDGQPGPRCGGPDALDHVHPAQRARIEPGHELVEAAVPDLVPDRRDERRGVAKRKMQIERVVGKQQGQGADLHRDEAVERGRLEHPDRQADVGRIAHHQPLGRQIPVQDRT